MKTHTGTGKRILSLILAVSMTFSMGLTSAFAANGSRATNSGDSGATVDSGVISVTLDTESANVFVGESIKIDATVLLDSGSKATKDVIWTSDKPEVATVDQNGRVTAVALDNGETGSGYATITANSKDDSTKWDSATIYVSQVTAIDVTPEFVKLINGDTYQLKAELTIYSKLPTTTDTVTWWSDNKAVATVDKNGLVTAVGAGDVKIYAEADSDPAIQDYANILVLSNSTSGGGGDDKPSSGGTTPSAPSATAPSNNVSANGEVKAESVKEETKTAIQDALKAAAAAGKPAAGGVTATVMVKNAESISTATLTEMAATAKAVGGKVELKADTVDATGTVTARLYIDPAAAAKLKGEIKLGVKTDEAATQATKEAFKNFDNKMAVASFAQQGSFGMAIKVAVKVDLTGLNTKTLVFTSFDKKTGKYVQLPKTAYTIDKNGYIHFTTSMGGEILITDKPLVKKAPAKAAAK
ncbi:MAG: Ig-like domain-containing protein [Hydrogenoanaerobacterium sp.]